MEIGENLSWKNKIRTENRKFGEREIRQMGYHKEGIYEKWIGKKRNWEEDLYVKISNGKKRNQQGWKLRKIEICKKRVFGKMKEGKIGNWATGKRKITYDKGEQEKQWGIVLEILTILKMF